MSFLKYLDEVKARAEKATDGPFGMRTVGTSIGSCHVIHDSKESFKMCIYEDQRRGQELKHVSDAEFFAASRTDVPRLEQSARIMWDTLASIRDHSQSAITREIAKRALAAVEALGKEKHV